MRWLQSLMPNALVQRSASVPSDEDSCWTYSKPLADLVAQILWISIRLFRYLLDFQTVFIRPCSKLDLAFRIS